MSILEAISPTARHLLRLPITKGGEGHRIHTAIGHNKTLCGILLTPTQADLGPVDCKRCTRIKQQRARSIKRLNGRRVSPNQLSINQLTQKEQ